MHFTKNLTKPAKRYMEIQRKLFWSKINRSKTRPLQRYSWYGSSEKQLPLQGFWQHQCVSNRSISRSQWSTSMPAETSVLDTALTPSEP